jgi:hypothetical protein
MSLPLVIINQKILRSIFSSTLLCTLFESFLASFIVSRFADRTAAVKTTRFAFFRGEVKNESDVFRTEKVVSLFQPQAMQGTSV